VAPLPFRAAPVSPDGSRPGKTQVCLFIYGVNFTKIRVSTPRGAINSVLSRLVIKFRPDFTCSVLLLHGRSL
jgi:hypothetical protein